MIDVGIPPARALERLRTKIQDLVPYQELNGLAQFMEEPDLVEAFQSAMEKYNDVVYVTQYTFSSDDGVRWSLLYDLAVSYAFDMIATRKMWNALAYSDSGFSVDERVMVQFFEAKAKAKRDEAIRELIEVKNADSINESFLEGLEFEY